MHLFQPNSYGLASAEGNATMIMGVWAVVQVLILIFFGKKKVVDKA
ncbi:hypothetical protein HPSMNH_1118 [Glaesserella parasuis MN-H]|nr:hypothetical protein HPSMNH_1118 [Glaesserella parasuis MN-H]